MSRTPLFRFLKAASWFGGGSVALAIVLFGISIYEHLMSKNTSAYWLVLLAAVFFAVGAYGAWRKTEQSLQRETAKSIQPQLRVELIRAFFDVCKSENNNELLTYIYAYLKVTNLNTPETVIKDGSLVLTIEGKRYKGTGDNATKTGNALEHVTDFKLVGEGSTEVFDNILSRFPRLMLQNAAEPLRRGIPQEGFIVFVFPELLDWNRDEPYLIRTTDAVLSLRDSFNGQHSTDLMLLNISNGILTNSGRFALQGVF